MIFSEKPVPTFPDQFADQHGDQVLGLRPLSQLRKIVSERVTSVAVEANLQGGEVALVIDMRGRPSLGHRSTDGGVVNTIYPTKVTL
jgi:hypothetical protein